MVFIWFSSGCCRIFNTNEYFLALCGTQYFARRMLACCSSNQYVQESANKIVKYWSQVTWVPIEVILCDNFISRRGVISFSIFSLHKSRELYPKTWLFLLTSNQFTCNHQFLYMKPVTNGKATSVCDNTINSVWFSWDCSCAL